MFCLMEGTTAKKRTSLWIVLFCMMLYMQVMGIFPGPHVIAEAAETDVTAVSALENLYQGNVYAPPGAKQFFFDQQNYKKEPLMPDGMVGSSVLQINLLKDNQS